MVSKGSIEAHNPEFSHISFFKPAGFVGICRGVQDTFFGSFKGGAAVFPKSLGQLAYFFMSRSANGSSLGSGHDKKSVKMQDAKLKFSVSM